MKKSIDYGRPAKSRIFSVDSEAFEPERKVSRFSGRFVSILLAIFGPRNFREPTLRVSRHKNGRYGWMACVRGENIARSVRSHSSAVAATREAQAFLRIAARTPHARFQISID